MDASTTIRKMLEGNIIFVPSYQRAYSWDTELEKANLPKHTNVFLSDLEYYNKNSAELPYYFGHFIFEEKEDKKSFGVIDGQQRLTTIVIFLSALFSRLKKIRPLNKDEEEIFEAIIKRNSDSTYKFKTVDYDDRFFKDCVIDQLEKGRNGLETVSAKRIANAFDFFVSQLDNKDEGYLLKMLDTIQKSFCTTHTVEDESKAIQMFIFQNNRGKKPTNLEIIKAQFMFNVNLYGGDGKKSIIEAIKDRFEKIYQSISLIEEKIREDDVLDYTLHVHLNSLDEINAIDEINILLSKPDRIDFIEKFTLSLQVSFKHLTKFFLKDERDNIEIHSLITLGSIGIAIPFIIKAYKSPLGQKQINSLCNILESIILRHKLIGGKSELTSRLNNVYKGFNSEQPDINPIASLIKEMKTIDNQWWARWNNKALENSIQGEVNRSTAKYLLWKYENFLEGQGKSGYTLTRFDKIKSPELEHIAPITENPEAGYDNYDDDFRKECINCLGNYLLLSKSHNCSVGNKPFADKLNSYNHSEQQEEIKNLIRESGNVKWTKELIQKRKEKIIKFVMDSF